ncbi:MAG: DUF1428 domain-containing protein [Gammaproteobacteria bacterium]|nr:DUF1428 domain-containing protein [Gammaproteobacteria bacterium]
MTYIDGFVLAVPTTNKQKFIEHANVGDSVFMDHGATRVLECWEENVPEGKATDFFGAVESRDDESVVFSWIEWPDKAARQAMFERMNDLMKTDERFSPEKNPMPFDGMRMIYGGFDPIVEEGTPTSGGYVQGFIVPVPEGNKEVYRKMARDMWGIMKDYGAVRVVEAWQDDVHAGKQTDFFRAVKAEPGEIVVFSFVEWSSRDVCDAAHDKMMRDARMKSFMEQQPDAQPPFDGKRLVYGGFRPVVELNRNEAGA